MNELFERWEAKTPDFWVKVKKIAIGLGSTALSI